MISSRKISLFALVLSALLLIGAVFVQFAFGGNTNLDAIPQWESTFPPNDIATNEAQTGAIETAEAEQIAQITPEAKKPPLDIPMPLSPTADPSSDGLISDSYDPMPGDYGYEWQNSWTSIIDSYHVEVAAGALVDTSTNDPKNPGRGVLRILTDIRELNGEYQMSESEGPLRIVGASNRTCLKLMIVQTKQMLQFDVLTREWTCSST